jgi:hypothetical protein
MLFRAESISLKIVFIPARKETTSDAENLSKRVFPPFFVDKENISLLLLIISGASEETSAEIIFLFPLISISREADLTLGVKQSQDIIQG